MGVMAGGEAEKTLPPRAATAAAAEVRIQFRSILLFVILSIPQTCWSFCPHGCSCDDGALTASCPEAQLELVPIFFNPQVHHIDLYGNRITDVHLTLAFYTNLRSLDISNNLITSLGKANFDSQANLRRLNVSDNRIVELESGVFDGLRYLDMLDLSGNLIDYLPDGIFSPLVNLRELFISRNHIREVGEHVWLHLHSLRLLGLDYNDMENAPVMSSRHLPQLQELDLSGNAISSLETGPFSDLRNLRALSLAANSLWLLNDTSFDGLDRLEVLDLRDNGFSHVPTQSLSKLVSLRELDLSGNPLRHLPPYVLHNLFRLEWLRVSRVPNLTSIHARALVDNTGLRGIELDSDPSLEYLPDGLWDGKPFLRVISLRYNGFRTFHSHQFPVESLEALYIAGNPVNCNCTLKWIWELVTKEDNATMNTDDVKCFTPLQLEGMALSQLNSVQLECHLPLPTVGLVMGVAAVILFSLSCVLMVRWLWKAYQDKKALSETPTPVPVVTVPNFAHTNKKEQLASLWRQDSLLRKEKLDQSLYYNGTHHIQHPIMGTVRQVPSAYV